MKQILCFGDSNTWGYNPETKGRYSQNIRWTSILQNNLSRHEIDIIEEGLCGRTTIYEDATRPNRKGIDSIPEIFNKYEKIDSVILMLGTNDCKSCFQSSPTNIAEGIDRCLDSILEHVSASNVLLVSPIHLGETVWKEEYDPEFDRNSVLICKQLKQEYNKVANKRGVHFLAASDYVKPSLIDQEHLNEYGHRILAKVFYEEIMRINLI